jgi:hypothetical protein
MAMRTRSGKDLGTFPLAEVQRRLSEEIASRRLSLSED